MNPITGYIKAKKTEERLNQAIKDGNDLAGWTEESTKINQKIDTEITEVSSKLAQTSNETIENTRKITEVNAAKLVPNNERPIDIPTYEGSGQTTHPDALYFPDGWNGYKYWLCHTPYPYSNVIYENPSIVASNDLLTWVEPAPNPIVPLESADSSAYNSDGNIFMVGDTMELWWRLFEYGKIIHYRKTTTDGVNWSEKEKLFDQDSFEMVRSQSVRYVNGKYCMWYNTGSGGGSGTYYNRYAESVDGKTWENVRTLDIELDGDYYWWHPAVVVTDKGYELFSHCLKKDGSGSAIFYSVSSDNVNFPKAIKIIDCSDDASRIDHRLYRASPIVVGDKYYVFYGAVSESREFKIALTKGNSPYELISSAVPKPNIIMSEENAYTPDTPLEKYTNNAITYTRIRGGDSALWPEGKSGTLITDRVTPIPKQIYRMNGGGEYERFANQSGVWLNFSKGESSQSKIIVSADNAYVPDDALSVYTANVITYTRITGTQSSLFPEGKSGTLITDRMTAIPKQIYRLNGGGEYIRYTNLGGSWLSFIKDGKIQSRLNVSSTIIPTLGSHKFAIDVLGVNGSTDVVVANPTTPLESGLFYNTTVQYADKVTLTVFNITGQDIQLAERDWLFTVLK